MLCRFLKLLAFLGMGFAALIGALPAAAHPSEDTEVVESERVGLGTYGRSGLINRSDLGPGVSARVTDAAIEMAQSSALADARMHWTDSEDFVWQVQRQLNLRRQNDYMSSDGEHIGRLMAERPYEPLGLRLAPAEITELERRLRLGDKIPQLKGLLQDSAIRRGEVEAMAATEGEASIVGPNFGGIWQDQHDSGRLVVALVDPSLEDVEVLQRVAGGRQNIKVIRSNLSEDRLQAEYEHVVEVLGGAEVPATAIVESTGDGKAIEIATTDVDKAKREISSLGLESKVIFVEGAPADSFGGTKDPHSEYHQQPGLGIVVKNGSHYGTCSWGANGHTNTYNYIVTAGHCLTQYKHGKIVGHRSGVEVWQSIYKGSGHLKITPYSPYVYSRYYREAQSTYPYTVRAMDAARIQSYQADSNCYHTPAGSCRKFIRYRALHNSWEINSDLVCATLGESNDYDCGYVKQEGFIGCSAVAGGFRFSIAATFGDSGSGVIGPYSGESASIDGLVACGDRGAGWTAGPTAYQVKQELGFDYNCRSYKARHKSASWWGSCPTINR